MIDFKVGNFYQCGNSDKVYEIVDVRLKSEGYDYNEFKIKYPDYIGWTPLKQMLRDEDKRLSPLKAKLLGISLDNI